MAFLKPPLGRPRLFNWPVRRRGKKYSGMEATHLKELKALKDENQRLKQMYAELSLDYRLAKEIIEKKR